ncbi:MAG: PadR family transcriptional regulator [Candidatus Lokiarchaeota archaeon]|nr:PadR family transcriptional regulator [Candidatus Lokiarchaeota archaeon]
MWPKHFNFFGSFMRELGTLLIFNTIRNCPDGLTYYDLKQFGEIPHSKIYRMMKKLEDKGDLIKKDDISSETGRPKHLYFLSKQGEIRIDELRENLGKYFEFIKERFPTANSSFDHNAFLKEATFNVWSSPVEFIIQKDLPNEKKLKFLLRMESDLIQMLEKIRKEKKKLSNI